MIGLRQGYDPTEEGGCEPRRSSQERRRVGYDAIPLDTPPLAAGSFIL